MHHRKRQWNLASRRIFFRWLLSGRTLTWLDRSSADLEIGPRGEREAERFFLRKGYWVIERSYVEKTGEIDLIVTDGYAVRFVEVKTRSSDRAGLPAEAVDLEKQRHISDTARIFMLKNDLNDCPVKFDVLSIVWPDLQSAPDIQHFESAFEATGEFQML